MNSYWKYTLNQKKISKANIRHTRKPQMR